MRDSVPSTRYSSVCNVLRQWNILIPTYRVYRLYDILNFRVIWKHFYSTFSSGDHGSLYQLRNKVNRTNVVKNPKNDFNACDDYFLLIISCYAIAATRERPNVLQNVPIILFCTAYYFYLLFPFLIPLFPLISNYSHIKKKIQLFISN